MIKNLSQIRSTHKRVCRQIEFTLDGELNKLSGFAQKHVRENPDGYKHRTGKLIQATKARVVKTRNGRKVFISNSRKYAASIDGGARPHVIRPRRGKFLRFMGSNGQWVFARKINHPGNRPYKFLWKATFATYRVAGPALLHRLMQLHRRI